MIRRLAAASMLLALTACAGSYDYATEAPAAAAAPAPPPEGSTYVPPAPVTSAPLQTPQPAPMAAPAPAPAPLPPPPQAQPPIASGTSIAAPDVAAPPPPRPAPPRGDIVVPGSVERQVAPPAGDPRSVAERARDIRAWDDCVMHVQNRGEDDPMRPQLDTPEDICRTQLHMINRNAVPSDRRP